jgi:hypothetical protein
MTGPRAVPAFVLATGRVKAVGRRLVWSCHCCDYHVSAMSEAGVLAAMDEHARFVNTTVDRRVDPHFDELRLEALLES